MELQDVRLDEEVPQQGELERLGLQKIEQIGKPIFSRQYGVTSTKESLEKRSCHVMT